MTDEQWKRAQKHYRDMFHDDMDIEPTLEADLCEVTDAADLEAFREDISAGQYDAIEYVLLEDKR